MLQETVTERAHAERRVGNMPPDLVATAMTHNGGDEGMRAAAQTQQLGPGGVEIGWLVEPVIAANQELVSPDDEVVVAPDARRLQPGKGERALVRTTLAERFLDRRFIDAGRPLLEYQPGRPQQRSPRGRLAGKNH